MDFLNIKNAGKKVKSISKLILFVNLILTFVIAIAEGNALPDRLEVIIPFLIIIIGILLSYIGYILIYAFGDLVESNKEIAESTKQKTVGETK